MEVNTKSASENGDFYTACSIKTTRPLMDLRKSADSRCTYTAGTSRSSLTSAAPSTTQRGEMVSEQWMRTSPIWMTSGIGAGMGTETRTNADFSCCVRRFSLRSKYRYWSPSVAANSCSVNPLPGNR